MEIREYEGKTKEEAIQKAVAELGIPANGLTIESTEETRTGIFGIGGSRSVKIRVVVTATPDPIVEDSAKAVEGIYERMGLPVRVLSVTETEEEAREGVDRKIEIEMESEDSGRVIGKHGKTLEAVQFLVNIIHNRHLEEDARRKIVLDIEGYRERRAQTLRDLALKTASVVVRTRRERMLEPMNPYDRRLVHLALAGREDVETVSEGDGVMKRVRVVPRG
jgi:spoIIIJ-associated protein